MEEQKNMGMPMEAKKMEMPMEEKMEMPMEAEPNMEMRPAEALLAEEETKLITPTQEEEPQEVRFPTPKPTRQRIIKTKRCPKGCIKKSRCKGKIMGGKHSYKKTKRTKRNKTNKKSKK